MSLAKLVLLADDIPWCGTRPPRPPLPGHIPTLFSIRGESELNPQPLPPLEIAAAAWQSVALTQFAQAAADAKAGGAAEMLNQRAAALFDEWCGTVPLSVLIQLLRHPPPPPPPWLSIAGQAAGLAVVGARMGGDLGKQLQSAAEGMIKEQLG